MDNSESKFELPEEPRRKSFSWEWIIVGVLVAAGGGVGIYKAEGVAHRQEAIVAANNQQIDKDQAALVAEKNKLLDMTQQLDLLKQQVDSTQGAEHSKAVTTYNQLATQQSAEREKYVAMAAQFNAEVTRLQQTPP